MSFIDAKLDEATKRKEELAEEILPLLDTIEPKMAEVLDLAEQLAPLVESLTTVNFVIEKLTPFRTTDEVEEEPRKPEVLEVTETPPPPVKKSKPKTKGKRQQVQREIHAAIAELGSVDLAVLKDKFGQVRRSSFDRAILRLTQQGRISVGTVGDRKVVALTDARAAA